MPIERHETQSGSEHIAELAVARLGQLATLPSVTLQIMRLADNPNATGDALNRLLATDPTLGARVLRVVNSAFYGLPGSVTTTSAAIVRLGFAAIRNIAIAASLTRMFRGGKLSDSFDAREVWQHSVAVAEAARLLAMRSGLVGAEEALLAGLLHDIGIVVAMQACRSELETLLKALEQNPEQTFTALELLYLGTTHSLLGAELCTKWGFPPSLALVARHHHAPMALALEQRRLPALIHVADHLAARARLGYTRTVQEAPIAPELLEGLRLSEADVAGVLALLPEATAAASQVLGDGG
jgi:putative nucleotidyltransferase with HDIG domain